MPITYQKNMESAAAQMDNLNSGSLQNLKSTAYEQIQSFKRYIAAGIAEHCVYEDDKGQWDLKLGTNESNNNNVDNVGSGYTNINSSVQSNKNGNKTNNKRSPRRDSNISALSHNSHLSFVFGGDEPNSNSDSYATTSIFHGNFSRVFGRILDTNDTMGQKFIYQKAHHEIFAIFDGVNGDEVSRFLCEHFISILWQEVVEKFDFVNIDNNFAKSLIFGKFLSSPKSQIFAKSKTFAKS